jgi:GDP-L-fucose synthase
MNKDARIFVAGHRGLVGGGLMRVLQTRGWHNLLTRTHAELDLRSQLEVDEFMKRERPEYVFLAAATAGGILANSTRPAEFIRDNLQIQTNVIDSAYRAGVRKLCFFGSSCIYPRDAPQPIREVDLLTGPLEPTNQWYAIAKIAGLKMCDAYRRQYGFNAISLMPTNLYGPGDNFDLERSHVVPALIRRLHEARERGAPSVTLWGTGTPRREFLFVDDLAEASVLLMEKYDSAEPINVGVGEDIRVSELAAMIRDIVGFQGRIEFDASKPDGTPRKLLDVSQLNALGWKPAVSLREGIRRTYEWYLAQR